MQKVKNTIRTCLVYIAVIVLAAGYPTSVFATEVVEPAPSTETVTPPEPTPEPEHVYTFNPETNRWDSDKWAYNPSTGNYEAVVVPLIVEEVSLNGTGDPASVSSRAEDEQPTSSSTITTDTNATINNGIDSVSTTGDATVASNTTAGNATTGDASAVATIMNMVNSSVSVSGGDFATFVTDIVGDVHGDIMLYPMLLAAMLQAAANPDESSIAVNNDVTITNDIDLTATSGDASVINNTTAGNAASGTANTVANVMNIINSIIAANQSFVGTVNIYGSLDGDILVAPDFFPQLLASNGGGSSQPQGSLAVSSEDTQSIMNNINLSAATGNALVSGNTSAGNAITGDGKTNLVLLNLSGHQIVANDSLLVFVNVLGSWVGLILDAPFGTTAAAIGNGVTSGSIAPDLSIDVDTNSNIVNNLNLTSQSGDATVAHNTTAGNATTGNATASANVANISGTQMGLSGWFGVLFINVFGDWLGNFGIDSEHGNTPAVRPNSATEQTPSSSSNTASENQPFQFVAKQVSSVAKALPTTASNGTEGQDQSVVDEQSPIETDIEAATVSADSIPTGEVGKPQVEEHFDFIPLLTATFIMGLGAMVIRNRFS